MFISSTGGHLEELLQLSSMFSNYDFSLITEKTKSNMYLLDKYGWGRDASYRYAMINPYIWESPIYMSLNGYRYYSGSTSSIGSDGMLHTSRVYGGSDIIWFSSDGWVSTADGGVNRIASGVVRCLVR